MLQLTLSVSEFYRDRKRSSQTFVFPLLLATGLGIAFRSRPAVSIAVLAGAPATVIASALGRDSSLAVEQLDDTAAATALRIGRIALLVVPGAGATAEYRYDAARPEARTARLVVDRALQRAAGQVDPVTVRGW
jgi:hypothetical protein